MTPVTSYRLAVAVALATVLLLLFGIGALGVIGDGGPADRVYLAVLAVLVVGSVLARFRPRGMALTLLATALTQVVVTVVAFAASIEGTEGSSVTDVIGLTLMFAGLFGLSALLFSRAARPRASSAADAPGRA
jgi:hypothetical protein